MDGGSHAARRLYVSVSIRNNRLAHIFPLVVRYGWVMESTPEAHMSRVKSHFDEGRAILSSLNVTESLRTYDIPDLSGPIDDTIKHRPSLADDW